MNPNFDIYALIAGLVGCVVGGVIGYLAGRRDELRARDKAAWREDGERLRAQRRLPP